MHKALSHTSEWWRPPADKCYCPTWLLAAGALTHDASSHQHGLRSSTHGMSAGCVAFRVLQCHGGAECGPYAGFAAR